jgi:predicted RNA-binding Zn-ribbon protein involved in translation (DUF1610 family)
MTDLQKKFILSCRNCGTSAKANIRVYEDNHAVVMFDCPECGAKAELKAYGPNNS